MTKHEVAKQLGISTSTLLRYIRVGVLPAPRRNLINGWRVWSSEEVGRLDAMLRKGTRRTE